LRFTAVVGNGVYHARSCEFGFATATRCPLAWKQVYGFKGVPVCLSQN
jgi:hypothetical protein